MAGAETVRGEFNYIEPTTGAPLIYNEHPENSTARLVPHVMDVHDMRQAPSPPTLEAEGFMAARLSLDIGDEHDPQAIAKIYQPLLLEFLKDLTSAPKVVSKMPMLRWSDLGPRPDRFNSLPARYVHADFARDTFYQMASDAIQGDPQKDRWLSGRYAVVQTWRALSRPPQDFPLAVLDRRTIAKADVIPAYSVIEGDGREQKALHYAFRHNPDHRWSYISNMGSDDMLVFIGFDSADDQIPRIPHSAFDYRPFADITIPRASCEMRAFVYCG